MLIYTRPADQGQIIEVSYGYDSDDRAYRRTRDLSDGSETWERGNLDWDSEPPNTDLNHVPRVESWEPCKAPS